MNVYFAFSIRGEKPDKNIINGVYEFLINRGHKVMTEFNIKVENKNILFNEGLNEEDIFKRDIDALEKSDILIADVTNPSLGVGYEIAHAINKNIKVYAFVKKGVNLSCMIKGNKEITLIEYENLEDLLNQLKKYF
ncbi:MAG TPA: nucleoside 2-deoxyribosyltransferase [Caldisericia bacterium]|nr:nucleoside 2-deoxyribosyltransferase [Caldisericia bacterium]